MKGWTLFWMCWEETKIFSRSIGRTEVGTYASVLLHHMFMTDWLAPLLCWLFGGLRSTLGIKLSYLKSSRFGVRWEIRSVVEYWGLWDVQLERTPKIQRYIRKGSRRRWAPPSKLGDLGGSLEPLSPGTSQPWRSLLGGNRRVGGSRLASLPARTEGHSVSHLTDLQSGGGGGSSQVTYR